MLVAMLVGCGSAPAQPGATPLAGEPSTDQANTQVLDRNTRLALGTLHLESTENAVTAQQAAQLLPLWQVMRSGTLQSEAETDAVLQQIERGMTSEQLSAIQAMQLTDHDLNAWAQSQGLNLTAGQGFRALGEGEELPAEVEERLREQFGGQLPSADDLAAMRAQRENMSEKERQAMREAAGADGGAFVGRAAGPGPWAMLLDPLIELLTERAAV